MQEALTPQEIQARVKRHYLERLASRYRKLRILASTRNWRELQTLCEQLAVSATEFGFPEVAACSKTVITGLHEVSRRGPVSLNRKKAIDLPDVRHAVEELTGKIDEILTVHDIPRAA